MRFSQCAIVTTLLATCQWLTPMAEATNVRGSKRNKNADKQQVIPGNPPRQLGKGKGKRKKKAGPKAGSVPKKVEKDRSQVELDFNDFPLDVSNAIDDSIEIQFESGGPTFTFELTMTDRDDEPYTLYTSENPVTGDTLALTIGITPEGESSLCGIIQAADGRTYLVRRVGEDKFVADIVEGFMDEDEPHDVELDSDESFVLPSEESGRRLQGETELDIMVVYTEDAMCAAASQTAPCDHAFYSRAIESVIQNAIAETNFGYKESNINARLRLVHSFMAEGYSEASSFSDLLGDLTYGRIAGVDAKRDLYGADFVSMLVGASSSCGIGWRPSTPRENYAFSVARWTCAGGYYSFGHEIGHNMGCNHDRESSSSTLGANDGRWNYGYRDPNNLFRTVMAYNCPNGGCIRRNRYSNPDITWEDTNAPMGASWANNAAYINARLTYYAAYRQSESFPTSAPAAAPHSGVGGITVGGAVYLPSEPIQISYSYGPSDTVRSNDLVVIYKEDGTFMISRHTCERDYHLCPDGETLYAPTEWYNVANNWPLTDGTYYAVLERGNAVMYRSADFTVSSTASVSLDGSVYNYDEPIEVTVTNPDPRDGDWVAVVPGSMGSSQIDGAEAEMWLYAACGEQEGCPSSDGMYRPPMMVFGPGGADEQGKQAWALGEGSYKMVLASGTTNTVMASADFEVLADFSATPAPTPSPTASPTPAPTPSPTPFPTPAPTPSPTPSPTPAPTLSPTPSPTPAPTLADSPPSARAVTPSPTPAPTPLPTPDPTPAPTPLPTPDPTPAPTPLPTPAPTPAPTPLPTPAPTPAPTPLPTPAPTPAPTRLPTPFPTPAPSPAPFVELIPISNSKCDKKKPCDECEGDCKDDDRRCADGLTCFVSDGKDPVPGCQGSPKKGKDYCVKGSGR